MARNGVWELEKMVLRYCSTSGSSRGVRDFVENRLISFAEKNPQIDITTAVKSGHPHLYGKYITGYSRRWCLKNLDQDQVGARFQEMRDTLGRKMPRHSAISNQVVEQMRVTVQGVWRNQRDFCRPTPKQVEHRNAVEQKYDLSKVMTEVGLAGVVHITKELIRTREEKRQQALDMQPKPYKVAPTE